ncbi:MAG: AsmA family protein [Caldimonas sp.]
MTPIRRSRFASKQRWRIGVALVVLVVVALALHPLWLAPLLGAYLGKTSGREVHFDSARVGLSGSLAPVLVLRGVRIANAPWADTGQPFAALAEVVFEFSWRRFEDRWVVTHTLLRDGEVNLARHPDGRRNWRLRDPEYRGTGHYWFEALEPQRATLRLIDPMLELRLRASASDAPPEAPAPAASEPLVNRIGFDGAWRGVAFVGQAATGPVLTFMRTDRWFALRGTAEIEGVRLELDGRAGDVVRGAQIDAQVKLSGSSLAALRPVVGDRHPTLRRFRAEGRLHADEGRYALSGLRARVGSTDLAGDVAWSRDGERRVISAQLSSDSADSADLLWLAGRGRPAAGKAAVEAAVEAPPRQAERAASGFGRDLDLGLSFDAKRLRVAEVPAVQSLKLKGRLAGSVLAVSGIDLGWAGGHSTGSISVDLKQHPAAAEASLETRGVRIESLFSGQDEQHRPTGALRGRLTLKASGDSVEALRASARGTVSLALSAGTIPSLLDAQMGLEGGKLMRSLLSGTEPLPLSCAAAAIDVSEGKAHVRSLVLDSANTRTTGAGTIDLRDATIELVLTPEPKRPGLLELRKSIRLSGRLPKPAHALVDRVPPQPGAGCEP